MTLPKGADALAAGGTRGALVAGHQRAAELGAWRLKPLAGAARTWTVEAPVGAVNPYWIDYRPLALRLELGPAIFEWATVTGIRIAYGHVAIGVVGIPTRRDKPR